MSDEAAFLTAAERCVRHQENPCGWKMVDGKWGHRKLLMPDERMQLTGPASRLSCVESQTSRPGN
jgi:hypothetical protein